MEVGTEPECIELCLPLYVCEATCGGKQCEHYDANDDDLDGDDDDDDDDGCWRKALET